MGAIKRKVVEPIVVGDPLATSIPLGDRIIIRRDRAEEHTKGGLILPDEVVARNKEERLRQGRVRRPREDVRGRCAHSVGLAHPPREEDPLLAVQWSGAWTTPTEQESDEAEYLILREDDILTILA